MVITEAVDVAAAVMEAAVALVEALIAVEKEKEIENIEVVTSTRGNVARSVEEDIVDHHRDHQ